MELELQRPLLFFDIESTGLNLVNDSIVELSFVKVFPDHSTKVKTWRVCPWDYVAGKQKGIDPQASEVNGIKDEDVAHEPKFIEIVTEVIDWLRDSDLAGFNSTKFDLPMLSEEIERARAYCLKRLGNTKLSPDARQRAQDLHEKRMIDVQTIYHYMEPRNLRAAYRFYCGGKAPIIAHSAEADTIATNEDEIDWHTAEADTVATYEVLKGQLEMYQKPNSFLALAGGLARLIMPAG